MTHKYNAIYHWFRPRLCLQIMLNDFQWDQLAVSLTPRITLAHNAWMNFAVGLDWLFGTVNFGVMSQAFVSAEKQRLQTVTSNAARYGLTVRQYTLRWVS